MATDQADFIIVGGGTAGIALATRLSEDADKQILVLEAGNDLSEDPRLVAPALWPGLLSTDADWAFMSTPQKALFGKSLPIAAGKMIGGSSGLNGCAFVATGKLHLDTVAKLGNPGWGWADMVPYYKKCYTLTLPSPEHQKRLGLENVDLKLNGDSGPIQASYPDAVDDPVSEAWVSTFKKLGFSMTRDPFSEWATGGYTNASVVDPVTKTRSYAGNAYFGLAKDRPNFKVITGAHVQNILLEKGLDGQVRAVGVRYIKGDSQYEARSRKEVVLSGGAFNSPKLLEMSGIGQRKLLETLGIPVVVENDGVGENLQDHIVTGVSFQAKDGIKTKDELMRKNPAVVEKAIEDYKTRQYGPFTIGGHNVSAIMAVPDFESDAGRAELEALLAKHLGQPSKQGTFERDLEDYVRACLTNSCEGTGGYFSYAAQSVFPGRGVTLTMKEKLHGNNPNNFISIMTELLAPLSRGTSHITSRDPVEPPAIDPQWLTNDLDVEILARHARFLDEIASTDPLKQLLKKGGARLSSSDKDYRLIPLEEVKEHVRASATTGFHPIGTCAMMPKDKGGVLDPRLRVYGVQGLRIADASIFPIIPRGNTTSAVYAVAEKAADLIKEDWSRGT